MRKQVLIALDQLGNALLGGYADETISARAWRNREKRPQLVRFINWLFNDPKHCEDSYESELRMMQLPAEYRKTR